MSLADISKALLPHLTLPNSSLTASACPSQRYGFRSARPFALEPKQMLARGTPYLLTYSIHLGSGKGALTLHNHVLKVTHDDVQVPLAYFATHAEAPTVSSQTLGRTIPWHSTL